MRRTCEISAREFAESAKIGLLHDVLGFGVVPHDPTNDSKQLAAVCPH